MGNPIFIGSPKDALTWIGRNHVSPSTFMLGAKEHAVAVYFCGPEAKAFYFDPNCGVYEYYFFQLLIDDVSKHMLAQTYCDATNPKVNVYPISLM